MNPVFTFAKKVKEPSIRSKDISDETTISKIADVVDRLESLPRSTDSSFDEIGLRTNPKKWVSSSLQNYPDDIDKVAIESLLFDFTDSMQTRMREETKYALALQMENKLLLCHSVYGEETITPEWRIIPRMLDRDNVLRYASFSSEGGIINVRYWEKEATSSFIEWLGLPRKQAFLFGGKYRIHSNIEGVSIEIQLTDEEIEKWLDDHPEIEEGRISLATPIQSLKINEISVGRKRYQHVEDFIQDYKAEKHGLPLYQTEYERLNSDPLPMFIKYYDEETRVVRIEGEEEIVEVEKTTPDFQILFADGIIEFRSSYISKLATSIVNGESLNVFHPGLDFKATPFSVASLHIYNKLRSTPLVEHLTDYCEKTNLQDQYLDVLLKYACLIALKEANSNSPITYFLLSLSKKLLSDLSFPSHLSKVENEVLEYKSKEIFSGNNSSIISRLSEDITIKLATNPCKVYIVGVEDNGNIDPIPKSRLKSDRIESIRKGVAQKLSLEHVYILPVLQDQNGFLLLVAYQSMNSI